MDDGHPLEKSELKVSLNPPPPYVDDKPAGATDGSSSVCTSTVGLCFLTVNCGVALYNSRHDARSVLFIVVCFADLVLLFHFLRVFERLPRGSPKRLHVKAAVWVLTAALTVMFSQRVAEMMPEAVAVIIWVMAAATILAGFYMFFLCRDEASVDDEKLANLIEGP